MHNIKRETDDRNSRVRMPTGSRQPTGTTQRLADIVTPECELVVPGVTLPGPEQIAGWMRVVFDAFPTLHTRSAQRFSPATELAVELHVKRTHTGPLSSPWWTFIPTAPVTMRTRSTSVDERAAADRAATLWAAGPAGGGAVAARCRWGEA
jgi:hypothetical protein